MDELFDTVSRFWPFILFALIFIFNVFGRSSVQQKGSRQHQHPAAENRPLREREENDAQDDDADVERWFEEDDDEDAEEKARHVARERWQDEQRDGRMHQPSDPTHSGSPSNYGYPDSPSNPVHPSNHGNPSHPSQPAQRVPASPELSRASREQQPKKRNLFQELMEEVESATREITRERQVGRTANEEREMELKQAYEEMREQYEQVREQLEHVRKQHEQPSEPRHRRRTGARTTEHAAFRFDRRAARQGVVWAEILGSPRAKRPHQPPSPQGRP
ncbi:hypothetical protein [Numidum massiliense]|uniref:hypothetical protein n=1 Tax=Numidum massiliense TaxID=1522315 RepID=UPI0006D54FBE|nr:hypothetical protein [Numidum massiliense]